MVSSGNADAALQSEGHISARRGGHESSLGSSMANGIDVMNRRTSIQCVMVPKQNTGSKHQFECEATMTHSA